MDPITGAAAITAGTGLLGGLLQQEANRKERERLAKLEAVKSQYGAQMEGQQNMQKGVSDALSRLMSQYAGLA